MMMSKPAPSESAKSETETRPKAPVTAQDAVADLERRLAMLSSSMPETVTAATEESSEPPDFAKPPAEPEAPPPAAAAAPVKGGKNALLARIMAAQERAKQAQGASSTTPEASDAAAAPPVVDLLSGEAPKIEETPPPPVFDATLLPPPVEEPPPPAFDDSLVPPPAITSTAKTPMFDPHAPTAPPPPSAPDFDLLNNEEQQQHIPAPVQPPPPQDEALEAILGLEGLSETERKALLEEQAKIMAAIESEKSGKSTAAALSAADAFEQRSFSTAVSAVGQTSTARSVAIGEGQEATLHGQEQTRQAIQDGTALLVQCLSCENWMQVTGQASLMFCPVCQTVSPVDTANIVTQDEAAQLQADKELAEQLQKEEYAEQRREGQQQRRAQQEKAKAAASGGSWIEWLGLSSSTTPSTSSSPERPTSFAQAPVQRGQVGVSRPPGMAAARTGEEPGRISNANSYDEEDTLLAGNRPAARVAQSQPLFHCVTDSISTAASSLMQTMQTDEEGNVHGVDSSSLLAISNAGREQGESSAKYEQVKDQE